MVQMACGSQVGLVSCKCERTYVMSVVIRTSVVPPASQTNVMEGVNAIVHRAGLDLNGKP